MGDWFAKLRTSSLRPLIVPFRAFSGFDLLDFAFFKGERPVREAHQVWHIRSVAHAFEDAHSAFFDLTGVAEVKAAQRPHLLSDFHSESFLV
jgi:hypothetical protein